MFPSYTMKGLINTISGSVYTLLGARAIHGQVKCLSKGKNSLLVVEEHPYPLTELKMTRLLYALTIQCVCVHFRLAEVVRWNLAFASFVGGQRGLQLFPALWRRWWEQFPALWRSNSCADLLTV